MFKIHLYVLRIFIRCNDSYIVMYASVQYARARRSTYAIRYNELSPNDASEVYCSDTVRVKNELLGEIVTRIGVK